MMERAADSDTGSIIRWRHWRELDTLCQKDNQKNQNYHHQNTDHNNLPCLGLSKRQKV